MTDLFLLFIENLLPIFLAAGTGYLLSRWLKADPRTLSQVTFYIFSPCLIFTILIETQVGENEILKMLLLAWGGAVVIGLIAWLTGQVFKLERKMLVAVMLTSIFMNSGNFGLSFNQFAFGQEGLAQAGIFFVSMSIATYSVGIFIASMGKASPRQALVNLLKVPAIRKARCRNSRLRDCPPIRALSRETASKANCLHAQALEDWQSHPMRSETAVGCRLK